MKQLVLMLALSPAFFFAQKADEDAVRSTINQLFQGMKNSDSVLIRKSLAPSAILQTITKNGEVKSENMGDFIKSIAKAEKQSLDERISFSDVLIDGNLASVWTPYAFYYKGQFSHCGVNSFQLVKSDNAWRIQYIIDTRRKDNCMK